MDEDSDDLLLLQACLAVEEAKKKEENASSSVTHESKLEATDQKDSSSSLSAPPGPSTAPRQPQEDSHELSHCLKKYFGHATFRPYQEVIVKRALEKRDQLVVMATGYGKSLCYQFPALLRDGLTVVISPLISLMEDQVKNLTLMGIKAAFLGSSQSRTFEVKENLFRGEYRVLYMTPELADTDSSLLPRLAEGAQELTMIAVDEAHCISEWGHDFRAVYRRLGDLRDSLPRVPFMALTATATPEVREDILRNLKLRDPVVTCTSFDRPNLFLSVKRKSKSVSEDFKDLFNYKKMEEPPGFGGPTIVYCPTRKTAELLHSQLKSLGVQNELYHAGLSTGARRAAHKAFSTDRVGVMVATVAFGMGIDKPDIRNVIHYGAPKDIESYYQEIGRAGRDGFPSLCTVLFSRADFVLHRHFLNEIRSQKFLRHKQLMTQKMEEYLETEECRRRELLAYFDKTAALDPPGERRKDCCDNCKLLENRQLLSCASRDGRTAVFHGRFGLGATVNFLRGLTCKASEEKKRGPLYGCGRGKSEKWWKELGRLLTQKGGYLDQDRVEGGFGFTVSVGREGQAFLRSCGFPVCHRVEPLMLKPSREMIEIEKEKDKPKVAGGSSLDGKLPVAGPPRRDDSVRVSGGPQKTLSSRRLRNWESLEELGLLLPSKLTKHDSNSPQSEEKGLHDELKGLRERVADENDVSPYMVASNRALTEMATLRPSTLHGMAGVPEFPEEKVKKFGQTFLDLILQYSRDHSLSLDTIKQQEPAKLSLRLPERCESMKRSLPETVLSTYRVIIEGKTVPKAADYRQLSESTVFGHVAQAVSVGLPISLQSVGLSQEALTLVLRTLRSPELNSAIGRLKPVKESLPDPEELSYNQLRVALGILEYEFGTETESSDKPAPSQTETPAPSQNDIKVNPDLEKISSFTVKTPGSSSSKTEEDAGEKGVSVGKRKLPPWMMKAPAPPLPKKQKSKSSVFGR